MSRDNHVERGRSTKRTYVTVVLMLLGVFFISIGFNTIDQLIIRYKYYNDWRLIDSWEMSYFWEPHWWSIYVASIFMLVIGGYLLGVISVMLTHRRP